MKDISPGRWAAFICLVLALVTVDVYWPVTRHGFTNYDDPDYVSENSKLQSGLTLESVRWAFTTSFVGNWHPLTWLSHMLDWQLFGATPGAHHLVNVFLHVANALLLFLLLNQMTGARWRSAIVAGLFALHPLAVESVAWMAERKNVLCTLFGLLTMCAYVRYCRRPGAIGYLAVIVIFALGLMAKPMLVTLPFVLLLLDCWPLGRLKTFSTSREEPEAASKPNPPSSAAVPLPPRSIGQLLMEKLPLLVLSAASSAVTFLVARPWTSELMDKYPFSARLGNALVSYATYLGKMILPEDLSVLYPHPGSWESWQIVGSAVLLVGISLFVMTAGRRQPFLMVGWLWYLGTLVPVIGLVQAGAHSFADRYTYLPLIGIFIMLVWGVAELSARWQYRSIAMGSASVLALAALAAGTRQQVHYWQNSETLFRHALSVTTNNAIANYNLAQALSVAGRVAEAAPFYAEAVRINPRYPEAHSNYGLALFIQGHPEEAISHYARALELNPRLSNAHFNWARVLSSQGKLDDALTHYAAELRNNPAHYLAHNFWGEALLARGKTSDAMSHFSEALRLTPNFAEGHLNLGVALAGSGMVDDAMAHLNESLRLQPHLAEAHTRLAMLLMQQRHTKEAVAHYREALRLKPDLIEVLNNLSWLLATHPEEQFRDGTEAVRLAEHACELTARKVPFLLGTLGAAYAEAGRFADAVKTAHQARELADARGEKEIVEANEKLEQLFLNGKPCRESAGR